MARAGEGGVRFGFRVLIAGACRGGAADPRAGDVASTLVASAGKTAIVTALMPTLHVANPAICAQRDQAVL